MVTKYLVLDTPYNQETCPSLIGQKLDYVPGYACCKEVRCRVK